MPSLESYFTICPQAPDLTLSRPIVETITYLFRSQFPLRRPQPMRAMSFSVCPKNKGASPFTRRRSEPAVRLRRRVGIDFNSARAALRILKSQIPSHHQKTHRLGSARSAKFSKSRLLQPIHTPQWEPNDASGIVAR